MFKRIVAVLREHHIGKVMCGVFVYFALESLADALEPPFLNRVVLFFNTHLRDEYPHFQPEINGLAIGLKTFDLVLFSVLAMACYRWLWTQREGEYRG